MLERIKLSVIIPLYNKAQSMPKTLDCVLAQTYTDFEVLVIDDGSTDGSAEVVRAYSDPRLRLISKSNGGVSSARNKGIREAQYDYLAFLDADDYWEPTYLEEQVRMITDFPYAAMWSIGWGYLVGDKKIAIPHKPSPYRGYITNYWTQKKCSNIFFVCVCVCRRSVFDTIEPYDERIRYGEDLDVAWRIIANYPVAFNSTILGYYRQDAENRACEKKHIPIESRIEYYPEKYTTYREKDKELRRYYDTWRALGLRTYLFEENDRSVYALTKDLDYRIIPFRFWLYYKTPYCIGKAYYRFENWVSRIIHRHK